MEDKVKYAGAGSAAPALGSDQGRRDVIHRDPRLDAEGCCWARFDPADATWTLCPSPVGPAGAAVLELAAGVTLTVDWADRYRVTSLVLPFFEERDIASPAATLTRYLLGEGAQRQLLESKRTELKLEIDSAGRDPVHSLCRLALLEDLRDDVGVYSAGPSLWAAESAALRSEVAVPDIRRRSAMEALRGAAALLELDWDRLDRDMTVSCLERATQLTPLVPDIELREALDTTIAMQHAGSAGVITLSTLTPEGPGGALSLPANDGLGRHARNLAGWLVECIDLDPTVGRYGIIASEGATVAGTDFGAIVSVRVRDGMSPDEVGNLWVRAFALSDGAMLCLEPLATDGDHSRVATARLDLPREYDLGEVSIDITADPSFAAGSGPAGMMLRAAELGRAATRAERAGRRLSAVRLWIRCAHAWAGLEDDDRSGLALWYAATQFGKGVDDYDALLEKAQELATGWAKPHLEKPRDNPKPFVAELTSQI